MNTVIQLAFLLMLVEFEFGVQAVSFVLFGDSTTETNGCLSELLGYAFPPSPPYSNLTRYSSYKNWVDYFGEALEDDGVEIIDCSCMGAMATSDGSPDQYVPGLLTQIQQCNATQDLEEVGASEDLVAILMIGGNDLYFEVTGAPGYPSVEPQYFALVFETATRQLLELGAKNVLIGNTAIQSIYSPFQRFFEETFAEVVAFAGVQRNQLINAQEEGLAAMKSEGLPVANFPMNQFYTDIQYEAVAQGLNAFDSCFNIESSFEMNLVSVLPDCTEFHQRMWIDGLHLSDWGHEQFSQKILDFIISQNIL